MIQRILKNKNKKAKALLVVLFLAFIFSFSNVKSANASCTCQVKQVDGSLKNEPAASDTGPTETDCSATCLSWGGANNEAKYSWNGGEFKIAKAPSSSTGAAASVGAGSLTTGNVNTMGTAAVAEEDNMFTRAIKWMLVGVLNLVGWLFAIAATLFAWVVDPANVSGDNGMLNKQAVKDVWVMVRDLLNMGFIMVLLFAAFGTIFQVDSLNLKKVWLNILINALLVNFSYPIARFIIDISNVTFYYLLNNLFVANGSVGVSGSSVFAGFGNSSSLADILLPGNYSDYQISYLIASIIFVFIMGMTLLIIAGLFVVRLVALTMLVMFSPIGFVGYILPDTRKYANDWWKQLLNYSFFAPIMIFGMAIALRIMEAMRNENFQSIVAKASPNAPGDQAKWIADAAFFVIPIIILWSTIGIAKKFGIEGASAVTGTVTKWGKKIANTAWSGTKWAAYGNPIGRGVKEGVKERSGFNRLNKWWKDPSTIEAGVKGSISNAYKDGKGGIRAEFSKGRAKTRDKIIADENKKKISEGAQDHADNGATAGFLSDSVNTAHPDKKDDIIKHAQAASAYQRLDHYEKKAHMEETLRGGVDGSNFKEMLTGAAHSSYGDPTSAAHVAFKNEQNLAKAAADNIAAAVAAGRDADKKDHQTVASFVNKQMKLKIAQGVKAK
ncbi:MAG: hypothetical protein ACD_5C00228G0002 [uncultured bacterium]|nr:MAG: hypothetical protein ACD_5C00228G0002 [uncultured bacterium]